MVGILNLNNFPLLLLFDLRYAPFATGNTFMTRYKSVNFLKLWRDTVLVRALLSGFLHSPFLCFYLKPYKILLTNWFQKIKSFENNVEKILSLDFKTLEIV